MSENKAPVAKKKKTESSNIFLSVALLLIIGVMGYLVVDLKKKLSDVKIQSESASLASSSVRQEVLEMLQFLKQDSSNGKVHENLAENKILKGKSITETMKAPTYHLCANDKFATIIKFHPSGYFMLWSETKENLKIITDHSKAETAYYFIDGKKMNVLLFDQGESILDSVTGIKTDKNNVITELSFSKTKFSRKNCPEDINLIN